MSMDRRQFTVLAGSTGIASASTGAFTNMAYAQGAARVVIIGGGPGGATVAHLVKKGAPKLDVTLIDVRNSYVTCFFSNLYIGGFRSLQSITHSYDGLRALGVKVVTGSATAIDTAKKTVAMRGGGSIGYDRLVVAPGIDFKPIEGYSETATPHAWKAGSQTTLLKSQLDGMRDGGTFLLAPPNNPYRCPPGPYERACMIAHYLKTKKPKSKLLIVDPKKGFSKQPAFTEAFNKYYKGIIDLHLTTDIDDFSIVRVDNKTKEVVTKAGTKFKFDAANIVPNQTAGQIALKAGLGQGDWCPIDFETFQSTKAKDVYVLGDASIAPEMPKSGFSANSQAKVVATNLLADLAKQDKFPPRFRNTCWSMVGANDSIKVGSNYAPGEKDGKKMLVASGGFVTKAGESDAVHKENYAESQTWYQAITNEIFAKGAKPAPAANKKG